MKNRVLEMDIPETGNCNLELEQNFGGEKKIPCDDATWDFEGLVRSLQGSFQP